MTYLAVEDYVIMVSLGIIVNTYQELFKENSHETILGQLPPAKRF